MFNGTKLWVAALFVALFTVTGCASEREAVLERNKELVRRVNEEVWNKGNLEIIDELFSVDFVWHFLPNGSETKGLDKLRDRIRNHRKAFPDWTETIRQIVAEGDFVAIHFTSTGTNKGSFLGNPPSGKQIQINEVHSAKEPRCFALGQTGSPSLAALRSRLRNRSRRKDSSCGVISWRMSCFTSGTGSAFAARGPGRPGAGWPRGSPSTTRT